MQMSCGSITRGFAANKAASSSSFVGSKKQFVSLQGRPSRQFTSGIVAMGRVESEILEVGFKAPNFSLPDPVSGSNVDLYEYTQGASATCIMVLSNHCPFVVHLKPAIAELAKEYQAKGAAFVAFSSNDAEAYPKDAPDKMADDAKANGYTFPYLFDESQAVAKAYQAACTPEFMVFDKDLKLAYHGQFDDTRPSTKGGDGRGPTGSDIRAALDAAIEGRPVDGKWRPSIGCNVKWVKGNAPAWYHG